MKNIKSKIATLWQNLTNAGKIRTGMTVQRRLEIVTMSAICALVVACIAALHAGLIPAERWSLAIVSASFLLLAGWLAGLRRAIAESQDARKAYMTETRRRATRACRHIGNIVVALLLVGAAFIGAGIALTICIKLDLVPSELLDLLPALRGLADKVIVHLNDGLSLLSSFIR